MKRIVLFLLAGVALLFAPGCGKPVPPAAGFSQDDLYLKVEGAGYRCNTDIEAVIEHLGSEYEYAEGMSCDYDGLDKSFLYGVAQFYTSPLAEGDMVNEIYTRDPAVSTSKGISVADSREKVLDAYGEDYEELGNLLIYRAPGERAALYFEFSRDGNVQAICLTTQPI